MTMTEQMVTPRAIAGNKFWTERGLYISNVPQAGYKITNDPDEVLSTVLGSCVAVCARDPITGEGGMNHFLLPTPTDGGYGDVESTAMRYGSFAVERMINKLIANGAERKRIEIKVFGGANMFNGTSRIGSRNADFVEEYLAEEGFRIKKSDLRGDLARKVRFHPATGEAWVKKLNRFDNAPFIMEQYVDVTSKPSDVELF